MVMLPSRRLQSYATDALVQERTKSPLCPVSVASPTGVLHGPRARARAQSHVNWMGESPPKKKEGKKVMHGCDRAYHRTTSAPISTQ